MTTDIEQPEHLLLARVYEFVNLVHRGQTAELISFGIKNELLRNGKDLRSLSPDDLIGPMWHAFRRRNHGLWVDHSEGPIMSQTVSWAVEANPFSRPHDMLKRDPGDPAESEPFHWEGESVEEGMRAFSRWLNGNRKSVCLLPLDTGADAYFSAYCPRTVADLAVAQFERAGLSTSIVEGIEMPPLTALRASDALGEVAVDRHGFVPSSTRVGRFVRRFNDDYTLVVEAGGGSRHVSVSLGVADHEMNGLSRTVMQDERAVKDFPTINVYNPFFERGGFTAAIDALMARAEDLTEKEIRATVRKRTGRTDERRLLNRKWPKTAQRALEARERTGIADSDDPFLAKHAAIASATRDYLREHDIA